MAYTADQYRAAAKKAMAAGDTAAAKRLIEAGRKVEASAAPESAPKSLDQRIAGGIQGVREGMEGFIDKAIESATGGIIGDEFRARLGAIGSKDYDQALIETRTKEAEFSDNHPIASGAASVLGAVAPVGGVGLATQGAGMARRIAASGATGAITGGLYGAMEGEGAADRVGDAVVGTVVGAGAGMAVPPLTALASRVVSPFVQPVMSALGVGNATRANRALGMAVERSGKTPDKIRAEIAQALAEGQPEYVVADALGNPGQRALSGLARRPGDGRREIVDFLENRQQGQGRRLGGEVADQLAPGMTGKPQASTPSGVLAATGPDITGQGLESSLKAARSTEADALYGAARSGAGPVDVRGALAAIDDRLAPMQGSGVKGDGIDARLASYRARLAAPQSALKKGETARELSDFDRVLSVKQDLQDDIGAAIRAGRNNEARLLKQVEAQLDSALEASSGPYRAANDKFRDASRVIDSVDLGRQATGPRVRTEDTAKQIGALTPEQKAAFGVGYGDRLLGNIENAAPGVDKTRNLTDMKVRSDLGQLARDPDRLGRFVDRERTMFETRRQAIGGSQTADNMADGAESAGFDASAIGNLLTGNFRTGAQQLVAAVTQAAKGENAETRQMIARALLSRDPGPALATAVSQVKKDGTRKAIADAIATAAALRGGQFIVQNP